MKTISARSENASRWKSKFASVLEVLLHACQVKIGEDRREEHVRPLPMDIVRRSGNHVRFLSFSPGRFFTMEVFELIRQKTRNTFTHPTIDSGISVFESSEIPY